MFPYKSFTILFVAVSIAIVSLYIREEGKKFKANYTNVDNRNVASKQFHHLDVTQYTEEAQKDLITTLPGLNFYYSSSFVQFSGYLYVNGDDQIQQRAIHYWYVESTNNPEKDPVILWTNGGPGCSGLLGFGTEFGPFYFQGDGTLGLNPHTWNTVANIIYIEQPVGVGYSFSTHPEADYITGDEKAKLDNFKVIQEFFKRFPERKTNEFYIASESYGGHYIPQLALEILDRNVDGDINFRGFLVGNPYVDPFSNDVTMIETYYLHGLFSKPLYDHWKSLCTSKATFDSDLCGNIIQNLMKEAGGSINPYALDYPTCTDTDTLFSNYQPTAISRHIAAASSLPSSQINNLNNLRENMPVIWNAPPFLPNEDTYHPCAERYLTMYLNRDDVKVALHVNSNRTWKTCTDELSYSQADAMTSQINHYQELIQRAKVIGSNLKMLVFSGDDDSVCSTASTQYWIYDIGVDPSPGKRWKPWKYNKQVAGYVTQFDLGDSNSTFTFATVHGAGHEVPAYRPAESLSLLKSFFSGNWEV